MSDWCLTQRIFISVNGDCISIFLVMIHVTICFHFRVWSSSKIIIMNFMPFKESIKIILVCFCYSVNLLIPRQSLIDFMSVFILFTISNHDFIVVVSSSFIVSSFPLLLLSVKSTFCKFKFWVKESIMLQIVSEQIKKCLIWFCRGHIVCQTKILCINSVHFPTS